MIDKSELDGALKVAEYSWREFNTRRTYEWRINFALWTALGIVGGLCLHGDVAVSVWLRWLVVVCVVGIVIWYICIWSDGLHDRNLRDRTDATEALNQARRLLGLSALPLPFKAPRLRRWSQMSQEFFTVVLGLMCIAAVWFPPDDSIAGLRKELAAQAVDLRALRSELEILRARLDEAERARLAATPSAPPLFPRR